MSAKRGLGRGFDSLIPTDLLDESFDPTASQNDSISDLRTVKVNQISPDQEQPRRHFDTDALDELAASIAIHGVIQPIVITPKKSGGYTIVAGERRFRAASMVGLDKIPAIVRTLSAQHKLELSLIENLQRKNLNILETATAYAKLRDQFNLTMEQIGKRVGGRSASSVSNTLRLLRLPQRVKEALASGELSEGQARPLIGVDVPVVERLLPQIIKNNWSARRIERVIADLRNGVATQAVEVDSPQQPAQDFTAEIVAIEKRLGVPVRVQSTKSGAGKIVVKFDDQDTLRQIFDKLT